MASSYFKLRILKQRCIVSNKITTEILQANHLSSIYKCRVCLEKGSVPIYGSDSLPDVSVSLQQFGGIKISETDSFPKHLCDTCYTLLQNAILFRKKALTSDFTLQKEIFVNGITDTNSDTNSDNVIQDLDIKIYRCKTCEHSFHSKDEYLHHKNSKQHRSVRVQCPVCYGLLTAHLFKKHLIRHKTPSHLICDICGKLYRKDNLVRHIQLHNYNLPFQCKLCHYRGRSIESLKIHMRVHTKTKPFPCDKCPLRFITRSNLNRHLLTHNKVKPYNCIECGRSFHVKHAMDLHFRTDHVCIKDYGCKTCANKYGTRKALMRHELRVHKRDKMAKGPIPLYMQAEYKI